MPVFIKDIGKDLRLQQSIDPSPELLELLTQTTWGDRGSQYRLPDFKERLSGLQDSFFITLHEKASLVGAYCFSRRQVEIQGQRHSAIYRTGFSIATAWRGKGYGKSLARAVRAHLQATESASCFSYGFVDSQNRRSLSTLSALNYQKLGSFIPLIFFRMRARPRCQIRALSPGEREVWEAELYLRYADHSLVCGPKRKGQSAVYVSADQGQVSLAVRAAELKLSGLDGSMAAWFFNLVKVLPGLRRYFVKDSLRFVTFEGIQNDASSPRALADLMESVLQRYQVPFALIFLDPRGSQYLELKKRGRLGWINRCYQAAPIHVLVDGLNAAADSVFSSTQKSPLYVAAGDVL